jgi:hypothetical protein
LLAVTLVALAAVGRIAWQIHFDPETRFLSSSPGAEWITEAIAPASRLRRAHAHEVTFRKTFTVAAQPSHASLRVRVHRAGAVLLNGAETGLAPGEAEDWKRERERDVSALLRAGENEIEVRARATFGPPAAWLVLEAPGLVVASDATWTAAPVDGAPLPVRLATTPMSAWGGASPRPGAMLEALRAALPWLAAFALAASLALLGARRLPALRGRWLLASSALAIAALAWHNRALDPLLGFDSEGHLAYVQFILAKHRLPLASDGWSMYHPPLYYAAGAAIFALFDEGLAALRAFRALNALAVALQCAAVLASLRILFPGEPRRVLAGFVLGAFVPMQLYLAQYVTNEVWTAAFASSAIYVCLRILARDDRTVSAHLALGALLGAALLTKVSALLVALVVLAVLGGRLLARGERSPRTWLASLGAAVLALVVVAGWSYARVWWHFGSPLVGNWDAASGFLWWQDPGYRTAWDYLRFGDSLTQPIFSAWHGCPDALYSTLWGDGLIGGMAQVANAPPWRYELMFTGYWLALLPSAGVLLGLGAALARLIREPRAEWVLLLGVALGTAFALLSLSLRLPFYAQCKAFYGLSALVPFAAFGGLGLDLVAARLGRAEPVLWILVGTWALCAYATYWST